MYLRESSFVWHKTTTLSWQKMSGTHTTKKWKTRVMRDWLRKRWRFGSGGRVSELASDFGCIFKSVDPLIWGEDTSL